MKLDVAVCLPREAETISLIRNVVAHSLVSFGVAAVCVDDIRLALSEACTNVIQHAAHDDEYEVRFHLDGQRCEITIENTRSRFDAAAQGDRVPDQDSPRGRGVAIMRAVMDRVDFWSEPQRGTIVHLVKTLTVDADGPPARSHADSRPPA
jgi:serine/threonine-protein kinase RsbW